MRHRRHGVGGRWVEGQDVKDAAAVEQQPWGRSIHDQNLSWIQCSACETGRVNMSEPSCQLDDVVPQETLREQSVLGHQCLLS